MSFAVRLLSILTAVAALLAAATSASASNHWMLVQAVGEVSVAAPGATPVAVKPSSPLPDGATIRTGATGRAVLLRGRETIVMSPLSAITLPSGAKRDFTQVRQQSGTLLFKIGKKPEAHFEVDTPYLAAVVKGTTFTVKVSSTGASVHVLEGAVEVATADRKSSFLTRAGQISSVFAKATSDIFTTGASLLNGPAGNAELWGTDVSSVDFGGDASPWSLSPETRVFNDTGLKARGTKPEPTEKTADRAQRLLATIEKPANETASATKPRQHGAKPKERPESETETEKEPSKDRERAQKAKDSIAVAKKPERKAKDPVQPKSAGATPKAANVWTVTQARGDIKIDGYAFTDFNDGKVRTLPPGTKVETGADSRLGVAHGVKEFIIDSNSLAILADAAEAKQPMVVSGTAVQYREETSRYEAVANLSPKEIAELQASGALDSAPSKEAAEASVQVATSGMTGNTASAGPHAPLPKIVTMSGPTNTKTEEVRTKVIGGLTLGLYGLTALLVLAFGAQWIWRRYKAKAKAPAVESTAQVRLRNIKGS